MRDWLAICPKYHQNIEQKYGKIHCMEAHSVRDHRKIEIVAEKKDKPKNKGPKRSVPPWAADVGFGVSQKAKEAKKYSAVFGCLVGQGIYPYKIQFNTPERDNHCIRY